MASKPDPKKKAAFLAAYRVAGTIRGACRAAKVAKSTHYKWMDDPEYVTQFERAQRDSSQTLEEEARRRASEGWEEPVYQNGQLVGTKRKYSDTLLIFLLKANNPGKFGDRVEQTHKGEITHNRGEVRTSVREALQDRDYVEYLRRRDLATDSKPGQVCANGKPRNGKPLANGKAPRRNGSPTDRPGNGSH